ncbi:MAG: SAM-dependent methyltransferase [Blautia sp.]
MLGEEFASFLQSYESQRQYGLRVNTLKITCEAFQEICPFPISPIPWIPNGYAYPADVRPSLHPYYRAGLYYLQEPSAMTPAACLPVEPGEAILDLCAAPGGKATELAAKLHGEGILVANDISVSRARALLRNLELFGAPNLLVTAEVPERLTGYFPQFFHKILLDAPCSGEGMFRKDESLAADWSPEKSSNLARIQQANRSRGYAAAWGCSCTSICTFAPLENECVIADLLAHRSDVQLLSLPDFPGFSPGVPDWADGNPQLSKCVRIWPHKMSGEGHFLALLKKDGQSQPLPISRKKPQIDKSSLNFSGLFQDVRVPSTSRPEIRGEKVYALPQTDFSSLRGLQPRHGLYLEI